MISNKKLNKMVTELFIIERKLNISTVFITQSYLAGPKNVRLNCIRFIIMRNLNKQERQQTAFNHSSDIESKDVLQNHILF